jgi:hypothetical protein
LRTRKQPQTLYGLSGGIKKSCHSYCRNQSCGKITNWSGEENKKGNSIPYVMSEDKKERQVGRDKIGFPRSDGILKIRLRRF